MNFNDAKSVFITCTVGIFLSSSFLIFPCNLSLAAESEEQRTAKLVEGAKKEGKLLWYHAGSTMEGEMILKKFKAKYPFIETQMLRTNAEQLLVRILSEHQAKRNVWDVTKVGGIRSVLLKQKGLFAKYISPQWKFISNDFKDPEGYWTSIYLGLLITAYNTRLVSPKEVPKTWVDLLDPKWKGKMGMPTDSYEWFANMLKIMGENKGLEYMKKLAEQNLQFRPGPTLNSKLVAAGEVSIGIRLYPQRIEEMKRSGAPIEWIGFDPVIPLIHPIAVSAYAPHPNTARLFVDFLLSKEGQELIASMYNIPTRVDVDPVVPRFKKGLKILPFDESLINDYDRYVKLYRDMNFR
jgi:iron(III) transport system substrate-binding protein